MPLDHAMLFASSPLPQAVLDATWRVRAGNAAWRKLVGGTVSDSCSLGWFDMVHPDDLALDLPNIGRLQAGGLSGYRCTVRLRVANGDWQVVELLVAAVDTTGQDGALVTVLPTADEALLTSHQSTAHQSTAHQSTAHQAAAAVSAVDDVRHVATALSHDVRQHARLAGIYCSLLARGQLSERQRAQLQVIASHSDRLQEVLAGLVRWLRLADEPVSRQPCDLASLWSAATDELVADFSVDCPAGKLPVINGDPRLLSDLLRELARNAVRYHGPGRACITLSVTADDRGWELRISDDGPGIAEQDRTRVLWPLQRLHTWEEVPGFGMGLALASRIATRHGGELQITTGPTGGCTVLVRLPR